MEDLHSYSYLVVEDVKRASKVPFVSYDETATTLYKVQIHDDNDKHSVFMYPNGETPIMLIKKDTKVKMWKLSPEIVVKTDHYHHAPNDRHVALLILTAYHGNKSSTIILEFKHEIDADDDKIVTFMTIFGLRRKITLDTEPNGPASTNLTDNNPYACHCGRVCRYD
jgi:hypothetical protein